jgi:hypothetical protein
MVAGGDVDTGKKTVASSVDTVEKMVVGEVETGGKMVAGGDIDTGAILTFVLLA